MGAIDVDAGGAECVGIGVEVLPRAGFSLGAILVSAVGLQAASCAQLSDGPPTGGRGEEALFGEAGAVCRQLLVEGLAVRCHAVLTLVATGELAD